MQSGSQSSWGLTEQACSINLGSGRLNGYAIMSFKTLTICHVSRGLPWWLSSKEYACNVGVTGSIPGSGRSPGGWHSNPLQYLCLRNPMDRGAWQARIHEATKSWTRLSNWTTTAAHMLVSVFLPQESQDFWPWQPPRSSFWRVVGSGQPCLSRYWGWGV